MNCTDINGSLSLEQEHLLLILSRCGIGGFDLHQIRDAGFGKMEMIYVALAYSLARLWQVGWFPRWSMVCWCMMHHDVDLHESIYTYIYIYNMIVRVCRFVCLLTCLIACLFACLFGCLSVCLFASLFVCLSLFGSWSLFVSIVFFIWLFAYISWFQLSIYLHVYLQKYFMHPNLVEANQSTVVQSYPMNSSLSLYTSYVTILEGFIDGELRKSQPL